MIDVTSLISNRRALVLGTFAAFGIALQGSAVVANAGGLIPAQDFVIALQGYGYGGGGDSGGGGGAGNIVVNPTSTTVVEPGLVGSVTVTNSNTQPISTTIPTTVVSTAPSGTSASVLAPPGSLPSGASISVGAVANTQALVTAAPPPPGVAVVAGFQINATSGTGAAITQLAQPVELSFSVPASSVPAGATAGTVELAFWNGSDWVVTPATITQNPDGSLSISATVTHFTLFAVMKQPEVPFRGAYAPAGRFNLMVWDGLTGTSAKDAIDLVPGKVGAIYSLDIARQRFLTYIVGAPAGASDSFTMTKGQPIIVRSPGQAPAVASAPAATAPVATAPTTTAPGASTTSAARRTTTVQSGDTLSGIGARTGVDWQKIASINNIAGPSYLIQPGQSLFLD